MIEPKPFVIDSGNGYRAEVRATISGAFAIQYNFNGKESRAASNYFTLDEATRDALELVMIQSDPATGQEYPHASDCPIWSDEPCTCETGRGL